jgi:hypothetical protein
LSAIPSIRRPLKALDAKGFEAAMDALRQADPALVSGLFSAVKTSSEGLRDAALSDIQDLSTNPTKLIMHATCIGRSRILRRSRASGCRWNGHDFKRSAVRDGGRGLFTFIGSAALVAKRSQIPSG